MPSLVRSSTARTCGSSAEYAGQGRGQCRIGGHRGLDQCRGSLLPVRGCVCRYPATGDGLDQTMHQYHAFPGGSDQGVAAQRGDRIPGRDWVIQQRAEDGSDVRVKLFGDLRIWRAAA